MKKLGLDIIMLGDPTSGKDTQAKILIKKWGLRPVESGKQWRKMVKKNDYYGKWLRRTFGKGFPSPAPIVKWFLNKKINEASQNKNLIFIGTPRLKPEAVFLVKLMQQRKRDFFVFYLRLPKDEIYKRAARRKVQEDTRANTKRRIDWHKTEVIGKTVKYFSGLGRLKFVNSTWSIKKVSLDIQKTLNDYQRSKGN